MRVAVVGGGINGVMSAWALAQRGHAVTLFEKGTVMGATSSASTKLLHGGLRYLEHGEFRLVREALGERAWWLAAAPALARPLRLLYPIFRGSGRPRWLVGLGLTLYDLLALGKGLGRHRWIPRSEVEREAPALRAEGILGAYEFLDGQMDDLALGRWAADRAREAGVTVREGACVEQIGVDGEVRVDGSQLRFDCIVNAAGPWAEQVLRASGIASRHRLDVVRGSHLVVDRRCACGLALEVPGQARLVFVLPYRGRTLIGTTEVRQDLDEALACSDDEIRYLLDAVNHYLKEPIPRSAVASSFAGLRPLIRSHPDPSRVTRDYALERIGRVVTVFGGKWTTARALGRRVADEVGKCRPVNTLHSPAQ
jgi:glycerol-3-phosphate dehydrogenase